jgi:hypothetical protein
VSTTSDPESRVCPDCGSPAGSQPFCASCGRNLALVDRLPTRSDWESSRLIAFAAETRGQAGETRTAPGDPSSRGQGQDTLERPGWLLLVASIVIPFLAVVPFILGIMLMTRDRVDRGATMVILSVLIFGLRLYFFASCHGRALC